MIMSVIVPWDILGHTVRVSLTIVGPILVRIMERAW